jgi:Uma2 family endonuclease
MPARAKLTPMTVPLRKPWTQAEFFTWAETQSIRYEFDGTRPVAMTGATSGHNRITRNLITALTNRLQTGPCEPLGSDAAVETINKAVRYPDALVTCSKLDNDGRLTPGVVVIFEVLSPSSGRIDRYTKVVEYAAVSSIRRYVIIESTSANLTVLTRSTASDPWLTSVLTGNDILRISEIGIEIPVSEIYARMGFPDDTTND